MFTLHAHMSIHKRALKNDRMTNKKGTDEGKSEEKTNEFLRKCSYINADKSIRTSTIWALTLLHTNSCFVRRSCVLRHLPEMRRRKPILNWKFVITKHRRCRREAVPTQKAKKGWKSRKKTIKYTYYFLARAFIPNLGQNWTKIAIISRRNIQTKWDIWANTRNHNNKLNVPPRLYAIEVAIVAMETLWQYYKISPTGQTFLHFPCTN